MRTAVVLQLACLIALACLGTMLVAVGAYLSGGLCLLGGALWFWRLYRDSEP